MQVERLAFRDTISLHDSVHQSVTVLRDSLPKLENRVHKVTVRVSALDELCEALHNQSERATNLEQWGDELSEHLNACLDRVANLERRGEELAPQGRGGIYIPGTLSSPTTWPRSLVVRRGAVWDRVRDGVFLVQGMDCVRDGVLPVTNGGVGSVFSEGFTVVKETWPPL